MKTDFNTYKATTPNFGMAIKYTPKAQELLVKRCSYNDWVKLYNDMVLRQNEKGIDMYVSKHIGNALKCDLKLGANKIKTYKENPITALFKSPVRFIQKITDEKAKILK